MGGGAGEEVGDGDGAGGGGVRLAGSGEAEVGFVEVCGEWGGDGVGVKEGGCGGAEATKVVDGKGEELHVVGVEL